MDEWNYWVQTAFGKWTGCSHQDNPTLGAKSRHTSKDKELGEQVRSETLIPLRLRLALPPRPLQASKPAETSI